MEQNKNIKKSVSYEKILFTIVLVAICIMMFTGSASAVGNHSMQETVGGASSSSSANVSDFYFLVDLVYMFMHAPITFIIAVVIAGIIYVIVKKNSSKIKEGINAASNIQQGLKEARELKKKAMLSEIQKRDPDFSEEEFKSKAQNIFVQLQNAWSEKNWQLARMYETDTLFNAHNRQFEEIVNRGRTNHIENITFVGTDVVEFDQDDNNDIAKVLFEVRLIDYTVDDETGEVVFGDRRKVLHLKYLYTFIRSKEIVTESASSINTTNCPSCGAPINVNASGMCEYCRTTVVNGTYDWVVSNVESKPHYN